MSSEKAVNSEQLPVTSEESPQSSVSSPQEKEIQVVSPAPQTSQKTQGVRVSRSSGVEVLHAAAKKAARSGSRSDVHEYMRIRRSFV